MRTLRFVRWSIAVSFGVVLGGPAPRAQEAKVDRTILQRQDLAGVPGYEVILAEASIPVGGREGRHTHPGTMIGYLTGGAMTFDIDGKLTDYTAGSSASVVIAPGVPHEGINRGKVPTKALVVFIVEKGKPLSPTVP